MIQMSIAIFVLIGIIAICQSNPRPKFTEENEKYKSTIVMRWAQKAGLLK